MNAQLIFLHGGPGLPDYLERYLGNDFPSSITTRFYTQHRGPDVRLNDLIAQLNEVVGHSTRSTILVGHSWGGVLALEYLRRHAQSSVSGLVLMDSFLCVEHIGSAPVFFTPDEMPVAGSLVRDLEQNLDAELFANLWGECIAAFDARDFVRTLRLPILNIFGEMDVRTPAEYLRTYAELNGGIRTVEVPRAGHFPFVSAEGHRRVVRAIADFVEHVTTN